MHQLNPLLEFFGFGKKKPISFTKLNIANSIELIRFLNQCLNCCSKFSTDDQDDWETDWYEHCEGTILPVSLMNIQRNYISQGFPKKLLKEVEGDLYYMFRDPLKYSMYGNIVKDVQNIRKFLMKHTGKPYPIFDKSKLKGALSIYNIELGD